MANKKIVPLPTPPQLPPGDIEPLPFNPPPIPAIARNADAPVPPQIAANHAPPQQRADAPVPLQVEPKMAKLNENAANPAPGERAQREQALQTGAAAGESTGTPGTTVFGFCRGEASCWVNALCCPFVMIWQSIAIYVLACCAVYALRCMRGVFCWPCRAMCRSTYNYRDRKFAPSATSIGAWQDKSAAEVAASTEWVRAPRLLELAHGARQGGKKQSTKLFEDRIEPRDIAQGGVGDCWLMAALAGLAEHPNLLRHAFGGAGLSERGKYYVRLFDGRTRTWHKVVIDDYVSEPAMYMCVCVCISG